MNIVLFLVIAILYAVLIGVTFGNMKVFNNKTKLIYIIIGTVVNLVITLIIVNISNINVQNETAYKFIRNIDILIFGAVNSIITLPTIGKYLNNTKMQITTKENSNKKMIFLLFIYVIILIFEVNYLKGLKI